MKFKTIIKILVPTIMVFGIIWAFKNFNFNSNHEVGDPIDSLNNVCVYYNGGVDNVTERNLSNDGYNIGLKYQCVEFVKRYYYEHLNHKMPDTYGHAKDFYDPSVMDGKVNYKRDLKQYTNPSSAKPQVSDLIVMSGTISNRYGHVCIVSKVWNDEIEIIQQNSGPFSETREIFKIRFINDKWEILNDRILGWLRK